MTMTRSRSHSRRRLDLAGLSLLVLGLVFGVLSYWQVDSHGANALILIPSVVAATVGASHVTKREATRR